MRIPKMKNIQVMKTRKLQKVNQETVENQRGLRVVRYIPENTYSINDHEETLKNETVEPKDNEGSDRSEITVRKEFFDMR